MVGVAIQAVFVGETPIVLADLADVKLCAHMLLFHYQKIVFIALPVLVVLI
jgi:hypothetical protein